MRRLFGMAPKDKEPPPPPPSLTEANTKLQARSAGVQQKLEQIDRDLLKYKAEWKKNPRNTMAKTRLTNLLKQKKTYESQLMMMDNQSFNMDQVQFAHEQMENTATTVAAMKEMRNVMQEKFKAPEMDIDAIFDMQDDMAELLDESNEINEVLGQDYGIGDAIDEDELLSELDMLEGEMAMESGDSSQVPSYLAGPVDPGPPLDQPVGLDAYGLPAAPTGHVPAQQFAQ